MKRFVLFLMLTACGGAEIEPGQTKPEPEQPPPVMSSQKDLTGTWAMKVVNGQILESFLGREATTITTLSLVRVTENLELEDQLCSLENTPYKGTTTTYSATTIEAFESERARVTIDGERFLVERNAGLLGWRPRADVMTEELPTEGSDPRVFDADGDGNPGATVSVSGAFASGDVYVVSRVVRGLDGQIKSEDRIEGKSSTDGDQEILGASNSLLTAGDVTSAPDPSPDKNTFVLVRIQAAEANCSAIVANAGSLF